MIRIPTKTWSGPAGRPDCTGPTTCSRMLRRSSPNRRQLSPRRSHCPGWGDSAGPASYDRHRRASAPGCSVRSAPPCYPAASPMPLAEILPRSCCGAQDGLRSATGHASHAGAGTPQCAREPDAEHPGLQQMPWSAHPLPSRKPIVIGTAKASRKCPVRTSRPTFASRVLRWLGTSMTSMALTLRSLT